MLGYSIFCFTLGGSIAQDLTVRNIQRGKNRDKYEVVWQKFK